MAPFDGAAMGELGGAPATPATGKSTTVLRGPVDRNGAQGGGEGPTNFKNG